LLEKHYKNIPRLKYIYQTVTIKYPFVDLGLRFVKKWKYHITAMNVKSHDEGREITRYIDDRASDVIKVHDELFLVSDDGGTSNH
jgi:hypothetical protein